MAKSAKNEIEETPSSVAIIQSDPVGRSTSQTHEQIAELAYRIWEEGGRQDGTAHQDWMRAEEESKT